MSPKSGEGGLTAWERWELDSFDDPAVVEAKKQKHKADAETFASGNVDAGQLTAWERYEMASFDPPVPGQGEPEPAEPVMMPLSIEEIERIQRQAHDEGYATGHAEGHAAGTAAGHAEGYAAGYAEGQARASGENARLSLLIAQLDGALKGFDQDVAEGVLALAIDIARQVVRQTIAVKPEVLLGTVQEALAQMPYPHTTIHLHPEDASLVRSYYGDQLAHAGHRIHEDPRLERGGCVIEAGSSQVDAAIATRWRRTIESLGCRSDWLEAVGSGPASAESAPDSAADTAMPAAEGEMEAPDGV